MYSSWNVHRFIHHIRLFLTKFTQMYVAMIEWKSCPNFFPFLTYKWGGSMFLSFFSYNLQSLKNFISHNINPYFNWMGYVHWQIRKHSLIFGLAQCIIHLHNIFLLQQQPVVITPVPFWILLHNYLLFLQV